MPDNLNLYYQLSFGLYNQLIRIRFNLIVFFLFGSDFPVVVRPLALNKFKFQIAWTAECPATDLLNACAFLSTFRVVTRYKNCYCSSLGKAVKIVVECMSSPRSRFKNCTLNAILQSAD